MSNPHMQEAVEAGAKALNDLAVAQGALDDWDQWVAEAEAALDAMLPHLRAMIAEEIRDYWEACGDLIDTHNGARLAFDAIAARIAEGPQQ